MTVVAETIAGLRVALATERAAGHTVALVPTMGALHDGHLALVERAREVADKVVVSIFVNPLQFGPTEDLDRYPRTLEADLAALGAADYVFAPSADEMYPNGPAETRIAGGHVATLFEGATRPGHFDGMLTVVAKLLHIVEPNTAIFGQKDAQQVYLVRRMVADLNLRALIDVVDIVREPNGLARSSRNRYLSAEDNQAALALSASLEASAASADRGADEALTAAQQVVASEPGVELDYLELVDPATFLPVAAGFHGEATAVIAAMVGTTRLIDNRRIHLP